MQLYMGHGRNVCFPFSIGFLKKIKVDPHLRIPLTGLWEPPKAQVLSILLPHSAAIPPPFFLCQLFFNAHAPNLSSRSALLRETKNLCYSATFWKMKERLPNIKLLNC